MIADRRPIASRDTAWASALARGCAQRGLSPNAISVASGVAAAIAALSLILSTNTSGVAAALCFVLAALGCQMRLVCNLIDGMVAIEGGKTSATGGFFNEFPDRISDLLIIAGLGVAADALALAGFAAALAVLTAYIRELGHRLTGVADFGGWMSKPQRMAVVTAASLLAAVAELVAAAVVSPLLNLALIIIMLGTVWVSWQRSTTLLSALRQDNRDE